MPEEDWELLPHKIIADLRDEVQALKEKMTSPAGDSDLVKAINELKVSISQMQSLFQAALVKISAEEEEELSLIKMIEQLGRKLPDIEKQNEQIAKAMVAIAEMVESMKNAPVLAAPAALMPTPQPASNLNFAPPPIMGPSMAFPGPSRMPAPPRMPSRAPPRGPIFEPGLDLNMPPMPGMPSRMAPPPPPFDAIPPPPPFPKKKGLMGLFK